MVAATLMAALVTTTSCGNSNKQSIQEAGSYRITIDQLKETISIVKQ